MAMVPDEQGIFYILVVSGGPGSGEFIYDASGNLRSANVGQVTTDPIQGITCQQGLSTFNGHGAVINLLSTANGAFFQYADNGSAVQGALILSTAGAAGTDPVTSTAYPAGQQGINPVFGSFTQLLGSAIVFGVASIFTRNASVSVATGSGAAPPYLETDSPEQTTASHAALRLEGASPDGTKPAQAILAAVAGAGAITRATNELLEVQGSAIASLLKAFAPGGTTTEETWHAPVLAAGFAAGSPAPRFQFEPVGGGRVRLAGIVNLTATEAAGTTIFTLPAGYLPAQFHSFVTSNSLSGYTLGARAIQVNNLGQVQLGSSGVNTNFVVLDGICFELD